MSPVWIMNDGRCGSALMRPIAFGVGIGRLVEAHVAVADLHKGQARRFRGYRLIDQTERARHPAGDGPEQAGARPGHAFENLAPVWPLAVAVIAGSHDPSPVQHERYADRIGPPADLFPTRLKSIKPLQIQLFTVKGTPARRPRRR
jgi:hypothetical protein